MSDRMAYTVDDTPGKGRRIVFCNKELDPDSGIPFRLPVLIKEKTMTLRNQVEVPAIIQRWLSSPSLPSATKNRKSKRLNKVRVIRRLVAFPEPPIRESKHGSYEAVWEDVGRVVQVRHVSESI